VTAPRTVRLPLDRERYGFELVQTLSAVDGMVMWPPSAPAVVLPFVTAVYLARRAYQDG
jgi:hypothetical protein